MLTEIEQIAHIIGWLEALQSQTWPYTSDIAMAIQNLKNSIEKLKKAKDNQI